MGPGGQRLDVGTGVRQRLAAEWAGGACWAERPRRAAAGLARLLGCGEKGERGQRAECEEGEEMIIFTFYFPNKFSQKHFQIIFDFI